MNKTELVHKIHKDLDGVVQLRTIDVVVDKLLDVVGDTLKKGEEVQLGDFGTFSLSKFAVKTAEQFTKTK